MKETLIAILALWLVCGAITAHVVIRELKSDLKVQTELYKACSAELMWQEMKNDKAGCIASAYQATKNGFDLEENLKACE